MSETNMKMHTGRSIVIAAPRARRWRLSGRLRLADRARPRRRRHQGRASSAPASRPSSRRSAVRQRACRPARARRPRARRRSRRGLPLERRRTSRVNKMCGSGMKAAMFAHDMLLAGSADVMVAGGMESMTNAPYLLPKARGGYRMGHDQVSTTCSSTASKTPTRQAALMGTFGEDCARQVRVHARGAGRVRDRVAAARASAATDDGAFAAEIAPVDREGPQGRRRRSTIDEQPGQGRTSTRSRRSSPRSRRTARSPPRIRSSISDGAAALVMMTRIDARSASASSRSRASSATRTHRAGAELVHHRAGRRDRASCSRRPAGRRRRRPVRGQRSVRRRARWRAMQELASPHDNVNVQRRRLRARPSDRRLRRAHHGHADPRAEKRAAASAASRRCASAAAKRRRWLSNWFERRGASSNA